MLNFDVSVNGHEVFLKLIGRIDENGMPAFQECLDRVLEEIADKVVINFTDTSFINSAGVGKFLVFYKKLKADNRETEVLIDGISDDLFTLFKEIRIHRLIEIRR